MQGYQEAKRTLHYAWIVGAVTFVVLLATAGIRATPGILIVPLETEFGWTRAMISGAVAVNIALFGIIGPFAASLMSRYGLRRVVLLAVALLALAVAGSSLIRHPWQLFLCWGFLIGAGTGVTSLVLAAVVVNRWFEQRRGLALGLLSAANATGQLVFLPLLASLVTRFGWRSAVYAITAATAVVFIAVWLWMKNDPSDMNLLPYGARVATQAQAQSPARPPLRALAWAAHSREFWILAATFFICGASTNGLIGTHLIPACMDHGIPEVTAAGLLALMGIFDIAGTTLSGWLTDRWNSRYLLFWYYALRGIALLFLPASLLQPSSRLPIFAVFYGLDWIATVPPTVRLATQAFGKENAGVVYGWIYTAHQLGASLAALGAGSIRTYLGDYRDAFWISGALCLMAATLFMVTRAAVPAGDEPQEFAEEPA